MAGVSPRALVLAGGAGTRLRERVPDLPKPLAPVAGRPFLEFLLDRLIAGGVRDITLCVGYRAERVTQHFGASYRGAKLRYSLESEPLGTGGALAHALAGSDDAPALVLNGDSFLHLDFAGLLAWYREAPAALAMVLAKVADASRYGTVTVRDGRVTGFEEKGRAGPGWINAGIYVITPALFSRFGLSGRFSLEQDLLETHVAELAPRAYCSDGYFIDIGVPADYERAQAELPSLA